MSSRSDLATSVVRTSACALASFDVSATPWPGERLMFLVTHFGRLSAATGEGCGTDSGCSVHIDTA